MSKLSTKMVITDLDGTLLNSEGCVSEKDFNTLVELGNKGVIRVVATGRSPYSFSKVIPRNFPIDYLVFSSGAGAIEWDSGEMLFTTEIPAAEVQEIVQELLLHNVDFMVHEPIPSNHRFLYHQSNSRGNTDFSRRVQIYSSYCQPYMPGIVYESNASQLVVILPNDIEWFDELKKRFPDLKVIRATSPIDGYSIWMEIFRKDVSKANGAKFIYDKLNIKEQEIIAVGNDFNDLDMLTHFARSFVVANAPAELKKQFRVVKSNDESGFSDAVEKAF
ncbi:MAG TPA: HAD hydrolase family protein [Perlabentimonas sp.]|jgi:Cof subfamily protein (haloacid dehalogenase superfamily)|nr:HAD hydrolase family protein [Bacteroidales bacterium]MDD4672799.1 HAD hydrolase family protein [Bacteroidales bacterium]MDY0347958.1 HAD hydrolase family protein [Tenuifilaceae bacterium]HZJ74562.1 HAD hydrolase family protein [Perlabentimonas sp.]